MGGTWTDAGSWEQFGQGGAGDGSSVVENAAQISGFLRIRPTEGDMFNQKRFINVANGTFTDAFSVNPEARIMKLNVAPFGGGTMDCWNYKNGNSRACIAFYSGDFREKPSADQFIWAGLTGYGQGGYESVSIPANAVVAAVWFNADVGFKDVVLRMVEGYESAVDEKVKEVADGLTSDYDAKDRNIQGHYSLVLEPYEARTWLDNTGSVVTGTSASHDNRTLTEVPILENFRGGRIGFYTSYFLNSSLAMLAFYDVDDTPIEILKTVSTNHEYREADIPVGAVLARVVLNNKFPEGKTRADYPVTLYAAEDSLTLYENSRKIQAGHKDYPLPLGVMDNLLVDAFQYNAVSKQFFLTSPFARDTGEMLYQVTARRSVRTNAGTLNMDVTFVFRIKKSANPNRLLRLVNIGGAAAEFNDEAQLGPLYHQNSILMGYVIRQEKEYLWVYGRTEAVAAQHEVRLISYVDSSKQEYEELELDMDRSFVIPGNYKLEELDIDKKYYTRPEKLHSNLVGKTCIVFADSLAAFVNSLAQDWGANIVSMAEGGNRMGYYTSRALSNWICEDKKVQNFRSSGVQRADYIVFAMGANDPSFTQCTADDVQFVLQNKRWFDSDAETDPFDALEEDDKSRFASAASLYAAAYSLCRLYPGAQVAIIPPYRTPGVDCTDYDIATYCSALFSERFAQITKQLREVADTLGALFIENKTRMTVASADHYHGTDGVHPAKWTVYQDMGSNIGHALNRYYDSLEEIIPTE